MSSATSSEIEILSPTLLAKLSCPARVAFSQQQQGGAGGRDNPNATIGNVFHHAMELVVLDHMAPMDAWGASLAESEARGVDVSTLLVRPRLKARFERGAAQIALLLASTEQVRRPVCETEFWSASKKICGTPVLVLFGKAGVTVIDYKSGDVLDESGVRDDYRRQLEIYAALVAETYSEPVQAVYLFSFKQGLVMVDVDDDALARAIDDAHQVLEGYNQRTPGQQPAVATDKNCQWCDYKSRCQAFWTARDAEQIESAGRLAVRGELLAVPESSPAGLGLRIASISLGKDVLVTRVPTELLTSEELGTLLAFTALRRRGESHIYEWIDDKSDITVNPSWMST